MQCSMVLLLLGLAVAPLAGALQTEPQSEWPRWKKRGGVNGSQKAQPATLAVVDSVLQTPPYPGCYMRMPSGCPRKQLRTELWRRDGWAEQNALDEAGCLARKAVWDKYCRSSDAVMAFVANSTSPAAEAAEEPAPAGPEGKQPELAAENSEVKPVSLYSLGSSWPWSRKRQQDLQDQQKQQKQDWIFDHELAVPTEPGCFMRMLSGCPKHPTKTNLWRHDPYAELKKLDKMGCYQRKHVWNKFCETHDTLMVYVANTTEAASVTNGA